MGDSQSGFQLRVSGYSGNAGDNLRHHDRMKFSTFDRDQDTWSSNCAEIYHGAFWYTSCHEVNLNGGWGKGGNKGPRWHDLTGTNPASFTEMKVRMV